MHNSPAVTPVPLTPPVRVHSGGATARGGGDATGKDNSEEELRSGPTSGCMGNYMLPGTYPGDAAKLRWPEQLRRRRSAAVPMAATRSSRPEPPENGRISKMEPTRSTGAPRERNWTERDSPAEGMKNGASGRKRGFPKSAPACNNVSKLTEG